MYQIGTFEQFHMFADAPNFFVWFCVAKQKGNVFGDKPGLAVFDDCSDRVILEGKDLGHGDTSVGFVNWHPLNAKCRVFTQPTELLPAFSLRLDISGTPGKYGADYTRKSGKRKGQSDGRLAAVGCCEAPLRRQRHKSRGKSRGAL